VYFRRRTSNGGLQFSFKDGGRVIVPVLLEFTVSNTLKYLKNEERYERFVIYVPLPFHELFQMKETFIAIIFCCAYPLLGTVHYLYLGLVPKRNENTVNFLFTQPQHWPK
jgi:hypothetical protein